MKQNSAKWQTRHYLLFQVPYKTLPKWSDSQSNLHMALQKKQLIIPLINDKILVKGVEWKLT